VLKLLNADHFYPSVGEAVVAFLAQSKPNP
jgi:hypothetical protein